MNLSRKDLQSLIEKQAELAVSIYMPTHRTGDIKQDPIRLNNLLKEAEEKLKAMELSAKETKELLEPAVKLLYDGTFWSHQGDALALFFTSGFFRFFKLPYDFQELVIVSSRFHIKPLLPLFGDTGLFYILALSQNEVRLIQCTHNSEREITPDSLPPSLSEVLVFDDSEKQLQFHTGTSTGKGKQSAIFHGHGVGIDDNKEKILRYFRQINTGVNEFLHQERSPLVLAAVDYLLPIYHQVNSYSHFIETGIPGNPEGQDGKMLREQAWEILKPYFEQEKIKALDKYKQAAGTGFTTNDLKQCAMAAYDGRIAVLLAALDMQKWGYIDLEKREVVLQEKQGLHNEDLIDFAVVQTLIKGGDVYPMDIGEIPEQTPVAALLRY
jgi:hypothetical protein